MPQRKRRVIRDEIIADLGLCLRYVGHSCCSLPFGLHNIVATARERCNFAGRCAIVRKRFANGCEQIRMKRLLLLILVAALYVLHQDFWFWRTARPLVFGFIPIGLFYHGCYTLVISLVMWLLVKTAWPSHLEEQTTTPGIDKQDRSTTAKQISLGSEH